MKKKQYMVLYMAPIAEFQKMMSKMGDMSPEEMKESMEGWNEWMKEHKKDIVDMGKPLGKTKRVDTDGITDTKNEIGGYSIVQAESHEEAAKLFTGNFPHFEIPDAWIEIMDIMDMPEM